MADAAPTFSWAHVFAVALGVLAAAAIRLVLLPTEGLRDDTDQFAGWVAHIASNGLPNAYERDLPKVPHTLDDALRLWEGSAFARSAFGDDVVDHYANMAKVELQSFNSTVTDWERRRNFERF